MTPISHISASLISNASLHYAVSLPYIGRSYFLQPTYRRDGRIRPSYRRRPRSSLTLPRPKTTPMRCERALGGLKPARWTLGMTKSRHTTDMLDPVYTTDMERMGRFEESGRPSGRLEAS